MVAYICSYHTSQIPEQWNSEKVDLVLAAVHVNARAAHNYNTKAGFRLKALSINVPHRHTGALQQQQQPPRVVY